MKYYKIKILSPIQKEAPLLIASTKQWDDVLNKAGISNDMSSQFSEEQEVIIAQARRKRRTYLSYSDKDGFYLAGINAANIFAEEVLDDDRLKKYLQDKEYELEETNDEYGFLRYRKE